MKYYTKKEEDGFIHVYVLGVPSLYEIGCYEIDGDGCYVFTANDTGDMFFFGHTLTEKNALKIIKKTDQLITRCCR